MKRISIVFAETDDNSVEPGQGFNVFLEGWEQSRKKLPDDELTAAEFWSRKMFSIVVHIMSQTGAVRSTLKTD
jgi:hypothetical protein